jgi:hypothetical protein
MERKRPASERLIRGFVLSLVGDVDDQGRDTSIN